MIVPFLFIMSKEHPKISQSKTEFKINKFAASANKGLRL